MNLHVYALKRSGNNVIRKWITRGRLMAVCGNVRPEYLVEEGISFDAMGVKTPLPKDITRQSLRYGSPRAFRMSSYFLPTYYAGVEDRFIPEHAVLTQDVQHVIIVRNLKNCLASRLQRGKIASRMSYPTTLNQEMERILDVWVQHVNLSTNPHSGVVGIYYDRWLQDESYRLAIGNQLGVHRAVEIPGARASGGGGSSFDGMAKVRDVNNLMNRFSRLDEKQALILKRCIEIPHVAAAISKLESYHKLTSL